MEIQNLIEEAKHLKASLIIFDKLENQKQKQKRN